MELTITNTSKKIKTDSRYQIDTFREDEEMGGILIGNRETFQLKRVVPLKNVSKDKKNYYQWSKWSVFYYFFFTLGIRQLIKDVSEGNTIIGDFHSQPDRHGSFSSIDMEYFRRRVNKYGYWLAGLLVPKTANRCVLKLNLYKESHTNYNKKPKLQTI